MEIRQITRSLYWADTDQWMTVWTGSNVDPTVQFFPVPPRPVTPPNPSNPKDTGVGAKPPTAAFGWPGASKPACKDCQRIREALQQIAGSTFYGPALKLAKSIEPPGPNGCENCKTLWAVAQAASRCSQHYVMVGLTREALDADKKPKPK